MQVSACELLFERLGDRFVVALEAEQANGEVLERDEVLRRKGLALQHGDVDFDLGQPTGVDGAVHEQQVGIALAQTPDRSQPAVRGAIVNDPADAARVAIRVLVHHLRDQPVEGGDAGMGLVAADERGTVDIDCGHVGPGLTALVLVVDLARPTRLGAQSELSWTADVYETSVSRRPRSDTGGKWQVPSVARTILG